MFKPTRQKSKVVFFEILQWLMRMFLTSSSHIIWLFLAKKMFAPKINRFPFPKQKLWSFRCVGLQSASCTETGRKNASGSTKIRYQTLTGWRKWKKKKQKRNFEKKKMNHSLYQYSSSIGCTSIVATEKRTPWIGTKWTWTIVESTIYIKFRNINRYWLLITAS